MCSKIKQGTLQGSELPFTGAFKQELEEGEGGTLWAEGFLGGCDGGLNQLSLRFRGSPEDSEMGPHLCTSLTSWLGSQRA